MAKNPASNVPTTQLPNGTYAQGASPSRPAANDRRTRVSGAPGGQFDEECARTALAKIKDKMK